MRTRDTAIEAENISKSYSTPNGDLIVLDDINFSVMPGETVAVVGVSGSGKSTLLALLAGLDSPTSGSISIFNQNLSTANEDVRAAIRNQYVGFVFQQFHLLPNLNAVENVALPLELRGESKAEDIARDVLQLVGLRDRATHYPRQLSGGEQQRVAIARAYCARPKIMFADEPTGNLDRNTATAVTDLLFSLNQEFNTALILVTHDEALAGRCTRTVRLVDGQIYEN